MLLEHSMAARACGAAWAAWVLLLLPLTSQRLARASPHHSAVQLLDNIFTPLFEVTRDPNSHPQLHLFLQGVRRGSCTCFPRWTALPFFPAF